ncbi:MAG: AsmA family protein [Hyphomicrobiaceae bacterium]
MTNGLLYIAGIIAVLLCALFAVPYFVDWGSYRAVFEEEATRIVGREVRVSGDVTLRLLPAPYVRFEKVRIAEEKAGTGEAFFRADTFTLWLAVPPLLKGAIEANQIELRKPQLRLQIAADGGGNWQGIGRGARKSPYLPSDVALRSVRVVDGTVSVHAIDGGKLLDLVGIEGELSAETLEGPYRVQGSFVHEGRQRELRLATTVTDADGSLRFRAGLQVQGGNSYALDGRFVHQSGRPRLAGTLSARLPVPTAGSTAKAAADKRVELELKGQLEADPLSLKLKDATLSFEQDGKPQRLTGAITAAWAKAVSVEAVLASSWLDLDHMAGMAGSRDPLATLGRFVVLANRSLPAVGRSRLSVAIDQAGLAGEIAGRMRVALERDGAGKSLRLQRLSADLPGSSHIAADGVVAFAADGAPASFSGQVKAHGQNAARFLNWLAGPRAPMKLELAEPFSLSTRLVASAARVSVSDLEAELGRSALAGKIDYRLAPVAALALDVESSRLDLTALAKGNVPDTRQLVPVLLEALTSAKLPAALAWLKTADVALRLDRVKLASHDVRDVDIRFAVSPQRLTISRLALNTDDGLGITADARVTAKGGQPKGSASFLVTATSTAALERVADALSLPADVRQRIAGNTYLLPVRLAGGIDLSRRRAGSTDLTLDGMLAATRASFSIRLDGGLDGALDRYVDTTAVLASPDGHKLLAQILAMPPPAAGDGEEAAPGRFSLRARGMPSRGLDTLLGLDTPGLNASFDGKIVRKPGATSLAGNLTLKAGRIAEAVRLFGLPALSGIDMVSTAMTARVAGSPEALDISDIDMALGDTRVRGSGRVVRREKDRLIEARLEADSLTMPVLLAPILKPLDPAQEAARVMGQDRSPWPEAAFEFSGLAGLVAKLHVRAARLFLDDVLVVPDAELEIRLAPGAVVLDLKDGRPLGGRLAGTLKVAEKPGGAELAAAFSLTGADLRQIRAAAAVPPVAEGKATLALTFKGSGLSPRGLMAVVSGSGRLELAGARLARVAPQAVREAALAFLTLKGAEGDGALLRLLTERLARTSMDVGTRSLALKIADGVLSAEPLRIETPHGIATGTTAVRFAALRVDSSWRIVPAPLAPGKPVLPGVGVFYQGPLGDLARLEPRISADSLERELTVRRMETEVEELERLRRLDEERARKEAERLRLEEERRARERALQTPVPEAPPAPPKGAQPPLTQPEGQLVPPRPRPVQRRSFDALR